MSKLFAAFAILGTVLVLVLIWPAPASAAPRPDGVRNVDQYEFSSHRRYYRRHYRTYRYVRPYPYWGPYPYYGYYRPYYRPYYHRPYVGFGFWW